MTNYEWRKNDEARSPKRTGQLTSSSFGFRISFVIRHSSFACLAIAPSAGGSFRDPTPNPVDVLSAFLALSPGNRNHEPGRPLFGTNAQDQGQTGAGRPGRRR